MVERENKLLRGKDVALNLTEKVVKEVAILREKGIDPTLCMVRVGSKGEDLAYQKGAVSRCEKCNITPRIIELDENISQEEYISEIEKLNNDSSVHGILCFRPLPSHIDEEVVEEFISCDKDVDSFSPLNMAKIMFGDEDAYPPCTPKAVVEILDYYGIELSGKKVAILGRSLVVGKPLSILMLNRDATVTICHSKTQDIKEITINSDIIVSCMGRGNMLDESYISEGAIILDVGINFDENGKMCGDCNLDSMIDKVKYITPVPGGVGAVTTSVLASHVVKACKKLIYLGE